MNAGAPAPRWPPAPRHDRRPAGCASALAVTALLVVPLVLITLSLHSTPRELDVLQQRDAPAAVTVDSTASWQPASEVSVKLGFDASAPVSIVAPPWKGTVTAVPPPVGTELHAGDAVLEIDGIRRLLTPSAGPLWRVPAWGDRGADIDGVAALLATMQLMAAQPPGTPFGAAHAGAVERLATAIGAAPSPTLDLGWLVWSPVPSARVSTSLPLGAPAPAPGSPLLALPRKVTSITVLAADGSAVADDVVRASTLDFGSDGTVPGGELLDAPDQIPALRRAGEGPAPGGSGPAAGVGSGGLGPPGGAATPGADGSTTATAATTTAPASPVIVKATRRGVREEHLAALPLGAVVTDVDGTHCVVTMDRRSVPVAVIGSDSARVFVRGADGQQVAANPASAFGRTTCR